MTQMDKNGSVFYRANFTKLSHVISRVKNIWNGNNIKYEVFISQMKTERS